MPTTDPSAALQALLRKLDALLPEPPAQADFETQLAFRWVRRASLLGSLGYLQSVGPFARIALDDPA